MKPFNTFLAGLLLAFAVLAPTQAQALYQDQLYKVRVFDQLSSDSLSERGAITSDVLTFVYTAGTKTLATLYSDTLRTSLANPITRAQFATDDAIKFYAAVSSVDIFVAHSDGSTARYAGVTPNVSRVVVNRDGVEKVLIAAFSASDNTETDTGLDFPYGVAIQDCQVETVTVDATETIDVGLLSSETAGDANGLLSLVSVATATFVANQTFTVGANETFLATNHYGALFEDLAVGTDANEDTGQSTRVPHVVRGSNAKSLTYTGSAGSDTAAGYIYCYFRHLR